MIIIKYHYLDNNFKFIIFSIMLGVFLSKGRAHKRSQGSSLTNW